MKHSLLDRVPYATPPLPEKNRWMRPAGYILLCVVIFFVVFQFQRGTVKQARKAEKVDAGLVEADEVKTHRGAIGRWRDEIRDYWAGENIYLAPLPPGVEETRPRSGRPVEHPNMPFVVVLLTPFAYLPVTVSSLVFTLLKVAVLGGMILMAASVVNHRAGGPLSPRGALPADTLYPRIPDWLVFLGVLAAIKFLISDIQHGNTNMLVAGAVIGHLWLYRQGRDGWAGAALALAVCLKLTPALFVLYWLYQREWKLLGASAAALAAMMLLPALLLGPWFYLETLGTWWWGLIYPGLVEGLWYPIHINQSLPAMIARYFTGGQSGNYLYAPDGPPDQTDAAWITVVDLGSEGARWLLRVLQAAMVLAAAWAVGRRRLDRTDGRRALHYGLIVSMMLLLNQRSWDHHATYLIMAHLAIVYAVAYGSLPETFRGRAGWVLLLSVVWLFLMSGDLIKGLFGHDGADRIAAYGIAFWHFLAVWVLCLIFAARLRDRERPYHADAKDESTREIELASPPPTKS